MNCILFVLGLNGNSSCTFHTGDGIGRSAFKINGLGLGGSACVDACLERKKSDESINGVTVSTDTSKCFCEKGMYGRDSNTLLVSCFIGVAGKTLFK